MSDAAERDAATYTHPDVTRSALAFLKVIARHIPEGQTATPDLELPDLAVEALYTERTARTSRDLLERIGKLKVHGGGRGVKVARYEILDIDGERPAEPLPLPLRADLRVAPSGEATLPLFADVTAERSEIASDPGTQRSEIFSDVLAKVGNFFRRCSLAVTKVGNFFRRWPQRSEISSDLSIPLPLSVSDPPSTTTYVQISKNDPERTDVAGGVDARARDVELFLTWWMATFPTYNAGAVYSLIRARDEPIVRELLDHGRPLDLLQAMAVLLWTTTTDGVHGSNRWWIAEKCTDRGLFALRHKANYLAREAGFRAQAAADAQDVWLQILKRIEATVDSNSYHQWFRETVLLDDRGDVIEVTTFGEDSSLVVEWITKHHIAVVRAAVEQVRPGARVEFVSDKAQPRKFG